MILQPNHINIIQKFFENKPVIKAYLFGSQARGEANEKSDIDLMVELDYSSGIGWEFIDMQLELQKMLACKVDLVSANGFSPHIGPFIEADKKLIYER